MIDLVWILALSALVIMALISVVNTLTFPRLAQATPARAPFVSLLIPARDEADVIRETVTRLLRQNFSTYEVILLDDGSTDGTAERARRAAAGDPRFRVLHGTPPPDGWLGKNWACQQLAREARGEILVFTDADVRWEPGALSALVELMESKRADTFTVWPTQETRTWGERLVVPMMMFVVMGYLPEICVQYLPGPAFAAANGQCLAFRRQAYRRVGGHAAVRGKVVEDVELARETKRHGLRLVMAEGNHLISARMYQDWPEVRDGFAKNILAGHGGQPALLLLSAAFHWLLFLLPCVWLAAGWGFDLGSGWPFFPLAIVGLGVGLRLLTGVASHQRPIDAFLLPLSTIAMTIIAAHSVWWHYRYGGPRWKGRVIVQRA